jgi:hypothetical protein
LPTFSDQGYARLWGLSTKSSGDIFGSATTDTGHYAVKWWDNTVEVNPSGDPFSKPAAGGKKAFEVYPVSEQGTSLLLHFDGTNGSTTFTDSSSNGLTATAEGTAEISTAESQFGGASGYFDGGGYLSIAADSALDLSGADFCIELWAYPNALASAAALISQGLPDTIENCWSLEPSGSNIAFFASAGDPGQTIDLVLSGSLATGEWSHIAVTCESGTARLFINGALVDSASLSLASTAGTPLIVGAGWYDPATRGADCYIDELRITKGSAIYTAAFTPPASALTSTPLAFAPSGQFNSFDISDNGLLKVRSEGVTLAAGTPAESGNVSNNSLSSQALDQFYTDLDAGGGDLFVQGNPGIDGDDPTIATGKGYTVFGSVPPVTSLLLNFSGTNGSTVFTDSSPNELTVTASGGAEISTAQSKFGGSSASFDGVDSLVEFPLAASIEDGIDFTVECWVRPATLSPGTGYTMLMGFPNTNVGAFMFGYTTGGYLFAGVSWTSINHNAAANPLSLNAWSHVAITQQSGTLRMFVDGQLAYSAANADSYTQFAGAIGGDFGGNSYFDGYIDDLRIIKGQALYTSNFTPPTSAFPTGAADPHWDDVSLLLHFDSDFSDSSANDLTVTVNEDAEISTAKSVFGGGSGYFDGTGDYLQCGTIDLSSGSWTVELWFYATDVASYRSVVGFGGSPGFHIHQYGTGELHINDNTAAGIASAAETISANTWHHVAVQRDGVSGVVTAFVDGAAIGTTSQAFGVGAFEVGRAGTGTGGQEFQGYIDDLRITNGVARYTSNFTPPTAQLTVYP